MLIENFPVLEARRNSIHGGDERTRDGASPCAFIQRVVACGSPEPVAIRRAVSCGETAAAGLRAYGLRALAYESAPSERASQAPIEPSAFIAVRSRLPLRGSSGLGRFRLHRIPY